jgi:hypothetical protein
VGIFKRRRLKIAREGRGYFENKRGNKEVEESSSRNGNCDSLMSAYMSYLSYLSIQTPSFNLISEGIDQRCTPVGTTTISRSMGTD